MATNALPRRARRLIACLASGAGMVVAAPGPSAAVDVIDLKAPVVVCGTGAPYVAMLVTISPSDGGFGASATAHVCNTTAIETAVTLQAVGAGATASPGAAGGPILFAPFALKAGNDATVSGFSTVSSVTVQSVVIDVTGVGVGLLAEPVNSCQIVYDRVFRQPFLLDGCNAAVTVLT